MEILALVGLIAIGFVSWHFFRFYNLRSTVIYHLILAGASDGLAKAIYAKYAIEIQHLHLELNKSADQIAGHIIALEQERLKSPAALRDPNAYDDSDALDPPPNRRRATKLNFNEAELSHYDYHQLVSLYEVLEANDQANIDAVCAAICRKIGRSSGDIDRRAFLVEYYKQLHSHLKEKDKGGIQI